jgi:hypothetical protein
VRVAADRFDSHMQTLRARTSLAAGWRRGTKGSLPRAALREMVGKTHFAITGEDTR